MRPQLSTHPRYEQLDFGGIEPMRSVLFESRKKLRRTVISDANACSATTKEARSRSPR
jgi:hypothetical protein